MRSRARSRPSASTRAARRRWRRLRRRRTPSLVTIVSVGSIVTFMVVAQLSRARGLARRGETVVRSGGLAHYVAYFFFVPYIVIAVRPGPELDMPDLLRWIGLALIVAGVGFSLWP